LLPADALRDTFMQSALNLLSTQSGFRMLATTEDVAPVAPVSLSPEDITRITRALVQIMGPIAPRLVTRAQARSSTCAELEANCADMIDSPAERMRFQALLAE
jgi:hypothetical protein